MTSKGDYVKSQWLGFVNRQVVLGAKHGQPCLRSGTDPVDLGRVSMVHQGSISFLPLWKQPGRKGLSERRGEGPPLSGRAAPAPWEPMQVPQWAATWGFLQDLVAEIYGSFVFLSSKH